MPLSKEQLMIPRVLCIGGKEGEKHYPDSKTKTGEIYEVLHDRDLKEYEKYPNCFKILPWWERDESELPAFVKSIETGRVYVRHIGLKQYKGFEPADPSDWEYQKQKEA